MNFNWSEEQLHFKNKVIAFAKGNLNSLDLKSMDYEGVFNLDGWKACADFGIQGLAIPKKYGGKFDKVDLATAVLAMESLGYACRDAGLCLALSAQIWTVQTVLFEFGSEDQRKRYFPKLLDGSAIACHGLTEPRSGSDIYRMETRAEKVKGGYLLNGEKCLITLSPIANYALVFAYTDQDKGQWGISTFYIDTKQKGFEALGTQQKMGLRTVPLGGFKLKDYFVSDENRIGKEGAGMAILNYSLELDKSFILATNLGAMQRQLEESISFVKERERFGQSISKFQSVSNRIADMKLRLELARLLLYKVAWLKQEGQTAAMEASLLKLYLSESYVQSSLDALKSYGGFGYLSENEVERDLRDAVGGLTYAGTSDIQREIITKLMGL